MNNELCDYCGRRYGRWRRDQRFCSPSCHHSFHNEEKRLAMKAWRERRGSRLFCGAVEQEETAQA
jgi:hypothetical protein